MDAQSFFLPSLAARISQGDIWDRVPQVFLRQEPKALQRRTLSKPHGEVLSEVPLSSVDASKESGVAIATQAWTLRALLMSYDCEIDSDPKHRLIALVRPINQSRSADELEYLRTNRNYAFFHLPAVDGVLPESYVDFRRITSIGGDLLASCTRVVSLADSSLRAFHFQLYRFLTRIELAPEVLEQIRHPV